MLVVGRPLGTGTAFGCNDSRNRRRARMETHINETTVMAIRFPSFLEREYAAILITNHAVVSGEKRHANVYHVQGYTDLPRDSRNRA